MSRVFITGIAGFLGSHLARSMLAAGHEVRGVDTLIGGDPDNVPKAAKWWKVDCCDRRNLLWHMQEFAKPDIVYHCAALAYEGLSVFSPSTVVDSIIGASTSVFSAAITCKVKRIVHCSSMARYGAAVPPFREDSTVPVPQDPYGVAKLAAEQMLQTLCRVHGVEHVIAVPHNIIGPGQKYDDPFRNVASIMLNRMMFQGKHPIVYGDGMQKRCFSYIDDCLSCLTKMAFDEGLSGEVINIGPDEQLVTINELVAVINDVLGTDFVPQYVPGRPQEVRHAECSSDKARALLNYHTSTTLRTGIEKMAVAMRRTGPRPFNYHLPIEIVSPKTPKTWTDRLF